MNDFKQKDLTMFHVTIGGEGGLSISGPASVVPKQIRPGGSCLRESCPNNRERKCEADPEQGEHGSLAPFRPLCPEETR